MLYEVITPVILTIFAGIPKHMLAEFYGQQQPVVPVLCRCRYTMNPWVDKPENLLVQVNIQFFRLSIYSENYLRIAPPCGKGCFCRLVSPGAVLLAPAYCGI